MLLDDVEGGAEELAVADGRFQEAGVVKDALELIKIARETVLARLGIELDLEVKILGEP